jgi:hypothetical protein
MPSGTAWGVFWLSTRAAARRDYRGAEKDGPGRQIRAGGTEGSGAAGCILSADHLGNG